MSLPIEPIPWRLEWSQTLSVGIPEIDAEHQCFIRLINELNMAISQRHSVEEVSACLRAIRNNAVAHFAHEEQLFAQFGYPDAANHTAIHAQLTLDLNEMLRQVEQGVLEYALIETGLKVKEVLVAHLLGEDMKYRDYFLEQGITA